MDLNGPSFPVRHPFAPFASVEFRNPTLLCVIENQVHERGGGQRDQTSAVTGERCTTWRYGRQGSRELLAGKTTFFFLFNSGNYPLPVFHCHAGKRKFPPLILIR